jgi:hypothetical protein
VGKFARSSTSLERHSRRRKADGAGNATASVLAHLKGVFGWEAEGRLHAEASSAAWRDGCFCRPDYSEAVGLVVKIKRSTPSPAPAFSEHRRFRGIEASDSIH